MDKRDTGVDAARGITILLVVAGHIFEPPAQTIIYVFHMPFFFFVGGYMHKYSAQEMRLVLKKARQLLIPYLVFLGAITLPYLYWAVKESGFSILLEKIIYFTLNTAQLGGDWTVFWFATCYFFTIIIYNALAKRLSPGQMWLACICLVIFATMNQFIFPNLWVPWAIDACAMAIPMFHIGAALGDRIFRPSYSVLGFFAILAGVYTALILWGGAPGIDMKEENYGWPFVTLLAAVAGTALCVNLGRLSVMLPYVGSLLGVAGAASMVIMYVHMPVQLALRDAGLEAPWFRFVFSVAFSLMAYALFLQWKITRVAFLGQVPRTR